MILLVLMQARHMLVLLSFCVFLFNSGNSKLLFGASIFVIFCMVLHVAQWLHITHKTEVSVSRYHASSFLGYNSSYAVDKDLNTAWYPSGWGTHDNNDDWIAYEFAVAVRIHAIRMLLDDNHRTASPKKSTSKHLITSLDHLRKNGPFSILVIILTKHTDF